MFDYDMFFEMLKLFIDLHININVCYLKGPTLMRQNLIYRRFGSSDHVNMIKDLLSTLSKLQIDSKRQNVHAMILTKIVNGATLSLSVTMNTDNK